MLKQIFSTFVFLSCVLASGLSFAATSTASKTIEIVNLPIENRRMVLETQEGQKMYSDLVEVAFNESQPMQVRWKALMAAAEAGKSKSVKDLVRAGSHNQWFMRNAALVALAEVNNEEAKSLAKKLVTDKALVVRSAAVETLRTNATADVRRLLWKELDQTYNFKKKESLWIRPQIVEILAMQPDVSEMKTFAKLLEDSDTRVQLPAVRGLEKLTGTRLGKGKVTQKELVALWKDLIKKSL